MWIDVQVNVSSRYGNAFLRKVCSHTDFTGIYPRNGIVHKYCSSTVYLPLFSSTSSFTSLSSPVCFLSAFHLLLSSLPEEIDVAVTL